MTYKKVAAAQLLALLALTAATEAANSRPHVIQIESCYPCK